MILINVFAEEPLYNTTDECGRKVSKRKALPSIRKNHLIMLISLMKLYARRSKL